MRLRTHTRTLALGTALAAAAALAGCGGMSLGGPTARAVLAPTGAITPNAAAGTVTFKALDHGVRISGELRGLPANAELGFHIHEKGDCGNNANNSGGHFNPGGGIHGKFGAAGTHAGELPSLTTDARGVARFSVDSHTISLTDGAPNNVVGRALVVHRDRDDFTSQPAGNSGPRIACAVIVRD